MFTNKRQDDWATHLPAAEFALNSRVHSGAAKAPFEIIYGYLPDFTVPVGKRSNLPSLDERLQHLAKVREEAEAAMRMTKERMKAQYERDKKTAHSFNVGDMVMLQAKDVKIHQPSPKLGPRQLGPFKILERIGDLDFKLELPGWLKLHPVFHVNRLSPYRDNGLAKPPPPDPVVVDGEEEYEVKAVTDSRIVKLGGRGNRTKLQYYVKWKGYGAGDSSWEDAAALAHAQAKVRAFHKANPSAPRKIAATSFADLCMYLRPIHEHTEKPDVEQFPEVMDLEWETGKYFGSNVRPDSSVV